MKSIDLGVFLPVTNNGWIISKTSPQFMTSFALNREVAQLAERIGFSYVFSMAKWRGFGGETDFWKYSLESLSLMAGLAAYAPSLRLVASVAPLLIHPAVFAKMAATIDDVTGGRLGINIVSAGNRKEYSQMGLYPPDFESFRYDYTEEWLTIVKRLWTEESVTYSGRYFTLDDCQSWPKPVQNPLPLVCATSSERGFRFIAEHCTDGFFGGWVLETLKARGRSIKSAAAARGATVRSHTLIMLIQGDTDAEAQRIRDHYERGADLQAIAAVSARESGDSTRFTAKDARLFYGGLPFVGTPERIASMLEELAVDGDVDGFLFIFPDFIEGLARFGEQVMPLLRKRGVVRLATRAPSGAPA